MLADKDPQKSRPFDIEQFLTSGNVLKKRVLDQLTRYRTEWRNPSVHDYTLDFDEDEALLAVVSVTVFAIVLCDQIDSKLAFNAAQSTHKPSPPELAYSTTLLELVASKVCVFAGFEQGIVGLTDRPTQDYFRLEGALAGFLTSELVNYREVTVLQNRVLGFHEVDILVERGKERVAIELKLVRSGAAVGKTVLAATQQAFRLTLNPSVDGAVVFVFSPDAKAYSVTRGTTGLDHVRVVAPQNAFSD